MNSVILIGRLARDPELRYTANTQNAVAHFTLAVDRPRSQNSDDTADFIRITVFGRQAETCDRYLSKGRQVAVSGRIQTGSYTNREGQRVYTTDVIANHVEFLGSKNDNGGGRSRDQYGGSDSYGGQFNQDRGDNFGGSQEPDYGSPAPSQDSDIPDSFQATEDDIPF